jgi:hypothetical protein
MMRFLRRRAGPRRDATTAADLPGSRRARLRGDGDLPLRFAEALIEVPHATMWDGPDDRVVLGATAELIDLLPTYDPAVFSRNVGTVAPARPSTTC